MSRDTKRKVNKWTMIICLTLVACFYIYPVFLMGRGRLAGNRPESADWF